LKKEGVEQRKKIVATIPQEVRDTMAGFKEKIKVEVKIHENWYYKNGEIKRADIANREKFLIDSIFEALGIDDRLIFEYTTEKVQVEDKKDYKAVVVLKEYKQ
jgi:hypothetical protein